MNFYEALNLKPTASTQEIEEAYRALARKVHPDLNRNDPTPAEARMKLLNRIRETLTDPKRRAKYDLELAAGSDTTRVESAIDETLRESRDDVLFWNRVKLTAAAGLVLGLLLGVGFWVHDSIRSKTVGLPPPPPAAPIQPPMLPPAPSVPKAAPAAPRPIPKKGPDVVEFGSSAEQVLSMMGKPDEVEDLPAQGIRILRYGQLRLVFKNNRLVPGSGIQRER